MDGKVKKKKNCPLCRAVRDNPFNGMGQLAKVLKKSKSAKRSMYVRITSNETAGKWQKFTQRSPQGEENYTYCSSVQPGAKLASDTQKSKKGGLFMPLSDQCSLSPSHAHRGKLDDGFFITPVHPKKKVAGLFGPFLDPRKKRALTWREERAFT